jgi:hypothetical protein
MKSKGIRAFIDTGTSWQNAKTSEFRPFNLYAGGAAPADKFGGGLRMMAVKLQC